MLFWAEGLLEQAKYVLLALNVGLFVWVMVATRRGRGGEQPEKEEHEEQGNEVLLVVAHPDDEVMFFGPTLSGLRGRKVHLLCLSNGGSAAREKEFAGSCGRLGAASWSVAQFEDGFGQDWAAEAVAAAVARQVRRVGRLRLRSVLTFDAHGVSGHPNHSAAWRGCRQWRRAEEPGGPRLLLLRSVPLWRKYLGAAEAAATALLGGEECFWQADPLQAWRHMRDSYPSQWLWYRRLSVLFSRYTFVNTYVLAT